VIYLAAPNGSVPVGHKMLRQRDGRLEHFRLPPGLRVQIDTGGRRPDACHDGCAGRIAGRRGAVGIGEQRPGAGEPVEIGRLDVRMPAQATDPVIEIIYGDEQDILLLLSAARQKRRCSTDCGEEASSIHANFSRRSILLPFAKF